jgi:hypothetical protein
VERTDAKRGHERTGAERQEDKKKRREGINAGDCQAACMADDEEDQEDDGPVVELGERESVEGQPLARVASRLTWPKEKSRVIEREGDSVVRTPEGPQTLADVLEAVDVSYFDTRQTFVTAVTDAAGRGPARTE